MTRIGYARVSKPWQNLEGQILALKEAGCSEIYAEKVSTRKDVFPELERMLLELEEGDTVVVFKMDRVARSMKGFVNFLSKIEEKGAGFDSLKDPVDTTSPGGKAFAYMFMVVAELERDFISVRTKGGLKAAVAAGKKLGRRKKFNAEQVAEIQRMLSEDRPVSMIARLFKVSRMTIYRIKNGEYSLAA